MDDEGIAALDGEANPHTENWLTIRCSVHEEDAPKRAFPGAEVSDSSGEKNSTHYPKYHEAGYRYAYDTGSKSVLDHDRHFKRSWKASWRRSSIMRTHQQMTGPMVHG